MEPEDGVFFVCVDQCCVDAVGLVRLVARFGRFPSEVVSQLFLTRDRHGPREGWRV
jgi:hypothetical protein